MLRLFNRSECIFYNRLFPVKHQNLKYSIYVCPSDKSVKYFHPDLNFSSIVGKGMDCIDDQGH